MDICSFQKQAFEKLLKSNIVNCLTIRDCIDKISARFTTQGNEFHNNSFAGIIQFGVIVQTSLRKSVILKYF